MPHPLMTPVPAGHQVLIWYPQAERSSLRPPSFVSTGFEGQFSAPRSGLGASHAGPVLTCSSWWSRQTPSLLRLSVEAVTRGETKAQEMALGNLVAVIWGVCGKDGHPLETGISAVLSGQ
ncbi:Hypothetical predicted protein [Podarcis lilfordi]|uniref:Uncharacterized protein n=1 Tax=Podarcis lilfordi TaxID=74358 RepID=A0AA35KS58_9SAUR|nr:Hypothetical predicted protein [Podarcis lilfordi]